MKLLIVGIDGATFDLVRPWAEAGHLPHLKQLMDGGVHANLASTLPPVTSPAWPTFMTGCNPGKHGVFDFIQPTGADFSLVNSTKIRQPTLWQWLSDAGYRVTASRSAGRWQYLAWSPIDPAWGERRRDA